MPFVDQNSGVESIADLAVPDEVRGGSALGLPGPPRTSASYLGYPGPVADEARRRIRPGGFHKLAINNLLSPIINSPL